jgi:AcrR family transcriptional regulator
VDATKVWLGDLPDKRAFGRPDDPFTYKIRLKRAPWLQTKLQLELLDGCDTGNWVPKATKVVLPGQVEVAWPQIKMPEWADAGLGYKGKACKFRVKDLRTGRILGSWDGPKVFDPVAWREWYQKQWESGKVSDQTFEAHNLVAQQSIYTITYIEDYDRDINLLLAGFKYLDQEYVQKIFNYMVAIEQPLTEIDPELKARLAQVLQIFSSIDIQNLKSWFETLAQAVDQGNFEEEYERLLGEGLDRFQEALLILIDSSDPEDARETIRGLAQAGWVPSAVLDSEYSQAREFREKAIERLTEALETLNLLWDLVAAILGKVPGGERFVEEVMEVLIELVTKYGPYLERLGPEFEPIAPYELIEKFKMWWLEAENVLLYEMGTDPASQFSLDIYTIVDYITSWVETGITGPQVLDLQFETYVRTAELLILFQWMTTDTLFFPLQWRLDQGWGTIHIAANSIRQGWKYKGLMRDEYTYNIPGSLLTNTEDWWAAILYLPVDFSPNGRDILAVARGDNCQECSEPAKIERL